MRCRGIKLKLLSLITLIERRKKTIPSSERIYKLVVHLRLICGILEIKLGLHSNDLAYFIEKSTNAEVNSQKWCMWHEAIEEKL